MSRGFMLTLIVIAAALLGWLVVEEMRRTRALVAQTNEIVQLPETSSPSTTASIPSTDILDDTTPTPTSETTLTLSGTTTSTTLSGTAEAPETIHTGTTANSSETESSSPMHDDISNIVEDTTPTAPSATSSNTTTALEDVPTLMAANEPSSETTEATTETPTTETTNTSTCSSFDEAGLLSAFDGALAAFIADASATYGDSYENLQYELSSKSGVIEGEQGVVTTTYSGTVQELSTGQAVSANGIIRATFSWDGCTWQVVDYSF